MGVGLHLTAITVESIRLAFKHKRLDILWRLPFVLGTIHDGYGDGLLLEFFFPKRQT